MNWELIFAIANGAALPFWLLLAIGPRSEMVKRIILYGGCGLLALAYAILLVGPLSGFIPDGAADGTSAPDFTTLSGVMAIFASPSGATIGWIHYLAFDLFVGLWVAGNADGRNISRIVQLPLLFFCAMSGPLGLVLYLVARQFSGSKMPESTIPR